MAYSRCVLASVLMMLYDSAMNVNTLAGKAIIGVASAAALGVGLGAALASGGNGAPSAPVQAHIVDATASETPTPAAVAPVAPVAPSAVDTAPVASTVSVPVAVAPVAPVEAPVAPSVAPSATHPDITFCYAAGKFVPFGSACPQ